MKRTKRLYTFRVSDQEGLWGEIRCRGATAIEARASCRRQLKTEEVEPNGSLLPKFTLRLKKPKRK